MGTLNYLWGSAFALAFALLRFAPEYSFRNSFLLTSFALFGLQFAGFAVWRVLLYPHFFSPLRHLPAPEGGSWIFGQFPVILKEPNGVPMERWINEVPNDGVLRYLHMFNSERLLLTSPKALAEVLVTKSYSFVKPAPVRSALERILGNGVLIAEGDEHKRQRKHLMPAFAFRHIKDLYPVFWTKAREVTDAMAADARPSGTLTTESSVYPSRVTLDIIGVAGMGQDFHAVQDEENSALVKTYRSVFTSPPRALAVLQFFIPVWLLRKIPSSRNTQIMEASATIKGVARDLVRNQRARLEKGEAIDSVDIISVALQSGGFSDEDLVNQLMTFMAAGHETTSSAMAWTTYLLCRYPEVQQRLREEVRTLPSLSDPNSTITATDIDRLPYLNAVCNESLRLVPPVALTLRVAAHDTTILDHPVPKGTPIILVPWAVNRSRELWGDDAAEFNPERWMAPGKANSGGATSNYSNLTFLHGPRSCIGSGFAKAEFAVLLAAWVGRFDISFEDPNYKAVPSSGGPTSKPKDLKLVLKPIEGW